MKMNLHQYKEQALRLRRELGVAGVGALALLVAAAVFDKAAVEPLQKRAALLAEKVERAQPGAAARAGSASSKIDSFYSYLNRSETTTDWLAKLYGIGKGTGVELKSAAYRTQAAAGKIERYEITLPVTGSYAQMREFVRRALAEIPVLSLDQMTLKRETREDGAVQAELKLTLHMVKK